MATGFYYSMNPDLGNYLHNKHFSSKLKVKAKWLNNF